MSGNLVDGMRSRFTVGHVERPRRGFIADRRCYRFGRLPIEIGTSYARACGRKRSGDGGPDAGAGTCHHGDLVGQALCGQSNLASL